MAGIRPTTEGAILIRYRWSTAVVTLSAVVGWPPLPKVAALGHLPHLRWGRVGSWLMAHGSWLMAHRRQPAPNKLLPVLRSMPHASVTPSAIDTSAFFRYDRGS